MCLSELNDLQSTKAWKRFIYLSENQPEPDDQVAAPISVNLVFGEMVTVMRPNTIIFRAGENWMSIGCVHSISCEPHIIGDILKIVCIDGEQYTIIARD